VVRAPGQCEWEKVLLPKFPAVKDAAKASVDPPENAATNAAKEPSTVSRIDGAQERLLKQVHENPLQPSSTYAEEAHLGTTTAVAARKSLVAAGLLTEKKLATSARGRTAIVLEVTKAGEQYLKTLEAS
jgi:hypothetical protein